ncbi:MAG: FitA-like ribbon-helix-helix domain-containing protein [Betaproteobacteria bacterium]
MTLSLSIKEVPADVADALRERARANHRSMQGELLHILEEAVRPRAFRARALMEHLAKQKLSTPSESARMIRETRDSR